MMGFVKIALYSFAGLVVSSFGTKGGSWIQARSRTRGKRENHLSLGAAAKRKLTLLYKTHPFFQCSILGQKVRIFKRVVARRAVDHTLNVIIISLYVRPYV